MLMAAEPSAKSKVKTVSQALAAAQPKVIGGSFKPRIVGQSLPFFRTFREGLARLKFLNQIHPEVCHMGEYCGIASRALDLLILPSDTLAILCLAVVLQACGIVVELSCS